MSSIQTADHSTVKVIPPANWASTAHGILLQSEGCRAVNASLVHGLDLIRHLAEVLDIIQPGYTS